MKHAHMLFAVLSILGFITRGVLVVWLQKELKNKLWKILPHVNDTLLLVCAIGLLVQYQWNPLEIPWLLAKLIALVVYIGLGVFALKLGKTLLQKRICWVFAVVTFFYIMAVAVTKSPLPI